MTSRFTVVAVLLTLSASPAASQDRSATATEKAAARSQKQIAGPLVVDRPSSFDHCVTGNDTRVHNLGLLSAASNVRIRFESDFDPIAAVVAMRIGLDATDGAEAEIIIDDDSGGLLEPLLDFQAPFAGSYTLHVADGALVEPLTGGCYEYELTR